MPKYAELADGRVLEFPDEASDQVMNDAVARFIQSVDTEDRIAIDVPEDLNLTPVENDVALDPNLTLIVEPNILQKNQAALNNAVNLNSSNPEVAPLREEADEQYNQMMQLAQMRFPEETIKSWENNPIGFKESFSFLDWEDVTPVAVSYTHLTLPTICSV